MNNIKKTIIGNQLPDNLHSILIGLMLGDGSLSRTSKTSNTRLEMSFGTNYKQFAEKIGDLFKEYMNKPVKEIEVKGANRIYINYRLKTKSLPVFNYYYDLFYTLKPALSLASAPCRRLGRDACAGLAPLPSHSIPLLPKARDVEGEQGSLAAQAQGRGSKFKKIVPNEILDLMNPIVLAYLIMTDGNYDKSRNRIRIYTNSYTKQEVEFLQKSISMKIGLYVGILHDRKDQ
jgi:hypothetical protein